MASRQNEKISALHEVLWKQGLPVHSSPLQLVAREVPEPPWHPLPGGAADREKIRFSSHGWHRLAYAGAAQQHHLTWVSLEANVWGRECLG